MTFGQLDERSKQVGAWLQSKGFKPGYPYRHHDAERFAVSGLHCRDSSRRLYGGECESALHSA